MILAVDVHYRDPDSATVAAILFPSWESEEPTGELVLEVDEEVAPYVPGSFYLRELPPILLLLGQLGTPYDCIVIDGYVSLGRDGSPGLGMHLWEAVGRRVPVVGIAKSRYAGTPDDATLIRGGSRRPLFVTAAGIPQDRAKEWIGRMAGDHRVPDLLKRVDRLAREGVRTRAA